MKKEIVRVLFECDRCCGKTERDKSEHVGSLISGTHTEDMHYGNSTSYDYDLCQSCSEDFLSFMKKESLDYKHYHDTTVGLFATDRPDLVDDSAHRVLFELTEANQKDK